MIGIVLVSHGPYAEALYETVKMMYGKEEKISAIHFKIGQSTTDLREIILQVIRKLNTLETLVLVDVLGGSPCNVMVPELSDHIELVTGLNLSMLIEILAQRKQVSLETLVQVAIDAGQQGIVNVKERLHSKQRRQ